MYNALFLSFLIINFTLLWISSVWGQLNKLVSKIKWLTDILEFSLLNGVPFIFYLCLLSCMSPLFILPSLWALILFMFFAFDEHWSENTSKVHSLCNLVIFLSVISFVQLDPHLLSVINNDKTTLLYSSLWMQLGFIFTLKPFLFFQKSNYIISKLDSSENYLL